MELNRYLNMDCVLFVLEFLDFDDIVNIGINNENIWKILVKRDFINVGIFVSKKMVKNCGGWYGVYNCLKIGMRWKDFLEI